MASSKKKKEQIIVEEDANLQDATPARICSLNMKIEGNLRGIPLEILSNFYSQTTFCIGQHRGYFTVDVQGMKQIPLKELFPQTSQHLEDALQSLNQTQPPPSKTPRPGTAGKKKSKKGKEEQDKEEIEANALEKEMLSPVIEIGQPFTYETGWTATVNEDFLINFFKNKIEIYFWLKKFDMEASAEGKEQDENTQGNEKVKGKKGAEKETKDKSDAASSTGTEKKKGKRGASAKQRPGTPSGKQSVTEATAEQDEGLNKDQPEVNQETLLPEPYASLAAPEIDEALLHRPFSPLLTNAQGDVLVAVFELDPLGLLYGKREVRFHSEASQMMDGKSLSFSTKKQRKQAKKESGSPLGSTQSSLMSQMSGTFSEFSSHFALPLTIPFPVKDSSLLPDDLISFVEPAEPDPTEATGLQPFSLSSFGTATPNRSPLRSSVSSQKTASSPATSLSLTPLVRSPLSSPSRSPRQPAQGTSLQNTQNSQNAQSALRTSTTLNSSMQKDSFGGFTFSAFNSSPCSQSLIHITPLTFVRSLHNFMLSQPQPISLTSSSSFSSSSSSASVSASSLASSPISSKTARPSSSSQRPSSAETNINSELEADKSPFSCYSKKPVPPFLLNDSILPFYPEPTFGCHLFEDIHITLTLVQPENEPILTKEMAETLNPMTVELAEVTDLPLNPSEHKLNTLCHPCYASLSLCKTKPSAAFIAAAAAATENSEEENAEKSGDAKPTSSQQKRRSARPKSPMKEKEKSKSKEDKDEKGEKTKKKRPGSSSSTKLDEMKLQLSASKKELNEGAEGGETEQKQPVPLGADDDKTNKLGWGGGVQQEYSMELDNNMCVTLGTEIEVNPSSDGINADNAEETSFPSSPARLTATDQLMQTSSTKGTPISTPLSSPALNRSSSRQQSPLTSTPKSTLRSPIGSPLRSPQQQSPLAGTFSPARLASSTRSPLSTHSTPLQTKHSLLKAQANISSGDANFGFREIILLGKVSPLDALLWMEQNPIMVRVHDRDRKQAQRPPPTVCTSTLNDQVKNADDTGTLSSSSSSSSFSSSAKAGFDSEAAEAVQQQMPQLSLYQKYLINRSRGRIICAKMPEKKAENTEQQEKTEAVDKKEEKKPEKEGKTGKGGEDKTTEKPITASKKKRSKSKERDIEKEKEKEANSKEKEKSEQQNQEEGDGGASQLSANAQIISEYEPHAQASIPWTDVFSSGLTNFTLRAALSPAPLPSTLHSDPPHQKLIQPRLLKKEIAPSPLNQSASQNESIPSGAGGAAPNSVPSVAPSQPATAALTPTSASSQQDGASSVEKKPIIPASPPSPTPPPLPTGLYVQMHSQVKVHVTLAAGFPHHIVPPKRIARVVFVLPPRHARRQARSLLSFVYKVNCAVLNVSGPLPHALSNRMLTDEEKKMINEIDVLTGFHVIDGRETQEGGGGKIIIVEGSCDGAVKELIDFVSHPLNYPDVLKMAGEAVDDAPEVLSATPEAASASSPFSASSARRELPVDSLFSTVRLLFDPSHLFMSRMYSSLTFDLTRICLRRPLSQLQKDSRLVSHTRFPIEFSRGFRCLAELPHVPSFAQITQMQLWPSVSELFAVEKRMGGAVFESDLQLNGNVDPVVVTADGTFITSPSNKNWSQNSITTDKEKATELMPNQGIQTTKEQKLAPKERSFVASLQQSQTHPSSDGHFNGEQTLSSAAAASPVHFRHRSPHRTQLMMAATLSPDTVRIGDHLSFNKTTAAVRTAAQTKKLEELKEKDEKERLSAEIITESELKEAEKAPDGQVYLYASQRMNAIRLQKQKLREIIAGDPKKGEKGKGKNLFVSESDQFLSLEAGLFDPEDIKKEEERESKAKWLTPKGFTTYQHRTERESNIHPKKPI
ncbi:uncharacterized protein MONOS_5048 [Monocercomonoides exilis]|uniref:uncharacterized protein n=1 Tax=Monocercomonoides exilis TaxID=2049356 RepID=UPI003559D327|nr:hypothetical protein MONOS_5048 [Monocercomonoides exilis]|eukprot:MONOS_5048.1-p1 / transcript=MONOS_5048.1 / gene=MONOS_5048 / organism=Monocercomonoides_exilis_PA203 / gene_product=unspecified product / transcript_product=unspecified product / location=Mono_scaffold00142:100714-106744(+) / protein_length=1867 / sequence_SO=supercontig / SO=protein_coding / is_pseudo=false